MSEPETAMASVVLDPDAERQYCLPGAGSRSMLFVFDGQQVGAHASSDSGDFIPGSTHGTVALTFWDGAARGLVTLGASFEVWYGGTIGRGRVVSVSWDGREG